MLQADGWLSRPLADAAKDLYITYGISERDVPDHQGVVRTGDIRHGRITTQQPGRTGTAESRKTRALLRRDDLVVVLVRRAGDAALVTEEHEGWVATRSVGIIRSPHPSVTRWLRIWLRTPRARAWIDRHVSAHVEPTLSLDALRKMPVLFPPRDQSERIDELVTLIEARTNLNLSIAADAMELADAYHGVWTRHRRSWPVTEFGKVARARTGRAAPPSVGDDGVHTTWVAPADILNASLPYIGATGQQGPAEPGVVCDPGTILIATRAAGGRAVVTSLPAAAGRSVLAVHPVDPVDRWWLLHELRSRGSELAEAAQGRHAREITQRAFGRLPVSWPELDVRGQFHRVAEPLHQVVQQVLDENKSLEVLLDTLLREISSGAIGRPLVGHGGGGDAWQR
ncbi:hypothetical protein [Streptomyces sp. NPDC088261]|uniref:restriction endonuclease subunit S n=1 Tax=Streptomyces sp. NPDC088261 TaxID=3365851 RepID=UPI003810C816